MMLHSEPDAMNPKTPSRRPLSVYASWISASFVGALLATVITLIPTSLPWINEDRWVGFILYPSFAILLGAAQAVVLSRSIPRSGRWILACLLGWLFPLLAITVASQVISTPLRGAAAPFLFIGASTGFAQWFLLRQYFPSAGVWIAATIAGWATLTVLVGQPYPIHLLLISLGVVPSLATGLVLAFWTSLRNAPQRDSGQSAA
jgi:hypothetical protein